MKRKNKCGKIIAFLILALSICAMTVCGYKLWETHRVYQIGKESYSDLADRVRPAESSGESKSQPERSPDVDIPDMNLDYEALQEVNNNAAAWLYCPDTVIDYPVMKATDYDYYLHHLPDGTYNANGTLFIDYNNAPDFSDKLTVIYGHHMRSGKMFGSLKGYKGQAYFNEHPYMYLYTEKGNYRIDLMYGCVIGEGQWRVQAFMFDANLDTLLTYAAQNTTFTSGVQYTENDRIVALSTCSYEFDNARYVVIGVLRPEYGAD